MQCRNQTVDKCSAPLSRPHRQNIEKTVSPRIKIGQRETEKIELHQSLHNPTKDRATGSQEKCNDGDMVLKISSGSTVETCEHHIYTDVGPQVDFQQPAKGQDENALYPLYHLPISKTAAATDDDDYLVPERKDELEE